MWVILINHNGLTYKLFKEREKRVKNKGRKRTTEKPGMYIVHGGRFEK